MEAVRAPSCCGSAGLSAAVAVLAHLSFAPSTALVELLAKYPAAVSVEEGFAAGGLGSLVAEAISQWNLGCRLSIRGVTQSFVGVSGGPAYMLDQHRLSAEHLSRVGLGLVSRRRAA